MSTNQILAATSLTLLCVCCLMVLIVLLGKPKGSYVAFFSGVALFCIVAVTIISAYLTLG